MGWMPLPVQWDQVMARNFSQLTREELEISLAHEANENMALRAELRKLKATWRAFIGAVWS